MKPLDYECLLPFQYEGHGTWIANPQRPFQPRGLLIWGVEAGDVVRHQVIGTANQIVAAFGDLPARWFSQADSYEQIAKRIDEGKEPPAWGHWDKILPGFTVQIQLANRHRTRELGPPSVELLMWGHALLV